MHTTLKSTSNVKLNQVQKGVSNSNMPAQIFWGQNTAIEFEPPNSNCIQFFGSLENRLATTQKLKSRQFYLNKGVEMAYFKALGWWKKMSQSGFGSKSSGTFDPPQFGYSLVPNVTHVLLTWHMWFNKAMYSRKIYPCV